MPTRPPNIRNLRREEWGLLKDLRIKSLRHDPQSFWEKLTDVGKHDDGYWKKLAEELTTPYGSCMFILEQDNEVAGFVYGIKKEGGVFRLGGLWINPNHRDNGYGSLLV